MGVFDDVFRTMLERTPSLAVPVINEVFHTSYSEEEKIKQYRNDYHTVRGVRVTDSYIGIRDRLYHLECQSGEDNKMEIRMIEYDFAIALENWRRTDGIAEIDFPHSCVLYLRSTGMSGMPGRTVMPEKLKVRVNFPDGQNIIYRVPALRMQDYTREEIFKKRLLLFIPYYIMRYENRLEHIEKEPGQLDRLADEYEAIKDRLHNELSGADEADTYTRLMEMTVRISNHVLSRSVAAKERIGEIMGGKVLELETDRILARGMEQGRKQGIEQGMKQGMRKGAIITMYELGISTERMIEKGYGREEIEEALQAKGIA